MDINKIIKLAKLSFDPEEERAIAMDLEKMVGFVTKIQEVDTSSVDLDAQYNLNFVTREDVVDKELAPVDRHVNSSDFVNGYYRVPKVIK